MSGSACSSAQSDQALSCPLYETNVFCLTDLELKFNGHSTMLRLCRARQLI